MRETVGRDLHDALGDLRAFQRLVVDEALDLGQHQVAARDARAILDLLERGRALAQIVERFLDLLVAHRDLGSRYAQTLIIAHRDLGPQIEGCAEAQGAGEVGLLGHDLRRQQGREVALLERPVGVFLDQLLDDFAADAITEQPLEHRARRAAGAKALEHHVAPQVVVGAVELGLDLGRFEFDGQFAPQRRRALKIDIHNCIEAFS